MEPEKMPEEARVYRIGEVAELLHLKTYVLRFWETEFPQLAPERAESGQRLYTDADVEILRKIRQLLYDDGMTIEGARKVLAGLSLEELRNAEVESDIYNHEFLTVVEKELHSVCRLLRKEMES